MRALYDSVYISPEAIEERKKHERIAAILPECTAIMENIPVYFKKAFEQGRTWVRYGNS